MRFFLPEFDCPAVHVLPLAMRINRKGGASWCGTGAAWCSGECSFGIFAGAADGAAACASVGGAADGASSTSRLSDSPTSFPSFHSSS